MRNFAKKLSAVALCTVFASMQIAAATDGLGNSNITGTTGGFVGDSGLVNGARTLEFNGDSHVTWGTLNVGAGETLNFNAVNGASGLTILNTVTSGMTKIYGQVNSNSGVAKLIISNPNGMLYDGASFSTAGDLMLTTQALNSQYNGANMTVVGLNQVATEGITIKNNSTFEVGGEFNLVAPDIVAMNSALSAGNGVRFTTRDGQNFLVSSVDNALNKGVYLKSVSVDGDVYILAGKDVTSIAQGGTINGDLTIDSQGIIGLNYNDSTSGTPDPQLHITGNVNAKTNGTMDPMGANGLRQGNLFAVHNTKVDGNMTLHSDSGMIEVKNVNVANDLDITTTDLVATSRIRNGQPEEIKHFVHINGDNTVGGNMTVNSEHNVHIGNYSENLQTMLPGSLNVGGDLKVVANNGSIAVTADTKADNISLTSNTKNILTDGHAVMTANTYKFNAPGHYIGGMSNTQDLINVMEGYIPLPAGVDTYLNIAGGDVVEVTADKALIKSTGDMTVNGVNANNVYLSAVSTTDPLGAKITLKDDVHANLITVDGATKDLDLNGNYAAGSRDYTFKFTDILDTEEITVNPDTTITWDMTDGNAPGWNNNTQTAFNTRIVAPNAPVVPPEPPVPTVISDDDAAKLLNSMERDEIATAIDSGEVFIPIGYAADLDEEKDTGVRKNVDGSVTVVRPFTPSNK